jgi:hypothetical protein
MRDVNVVRKWAVTILSDGINKYFLSFCVVFMASVPELNCHTVYLSRFETAMPAEAFVNYLTVA